MIPRRGVTAIVCLLLAMVVACGGDSLSQPNDEINGPGPRLNRDHWNAVYAVWDCTLDDGRGGWLPHFDSWDDPLGVHSHDDGLISIHPFVAESAGENAQLGLFADSMRIHLNDQALVLDDGRALAEAGASCDDQPVTLHLRHWDTDVQALNGEPPQVITDDLRAARFRNDREVWVIAFAPLSADVPLPPDYRFDLLDSVSAPLEYAP